jgi:hypothetical protein
MSKSKRDYPVSGLIVGIKARLDDASASCFYFAGVNEVAGQRNCQANSAVPYGNNI